MQNNHHILLYLFIYLNISGYHNCGNSKVRLYAHQQPHLTPKIPPKNSLQAAPIAPQEEASIDLNKPSNTLPDQAENPVSSSRHQSVAKYTVASANCPSNVGSGGSSSGSTGGANTGGGTTQTKSNDDNTGDDNTGDKNNDDNRGDDKTGGDKTDDNTGDDDSNNPNMAITDDASFRYIVINYLKSNKNDPYKEYSITTIDLVYFFSLAEKERKLGLSTALLTAFNNDLPAIQEFLNNIGKTVHESELLSLLQYNANALMLGHGENYTVTMTTDPTDSILTSNDFVGNANRIDAPEETVEKFPAITESDRGKTTNQRKESTHPLMCFKQVRNDVNDVIRQPNVNNIAALAQAYGFQTFINVVNFCGLNLEIASKTGGFRLKRRINRVQ